MAGEISEAEKNLKVDNKVNTNIVKKTKSILSYQNGSELYTEEIKDARIPGDGHTEQLTMSKEPFSEDQNLKSECLDLLRKKLISDLSLSVFSPDLENKLAKMEPNEINKERQSVVQKLLLQISQLSDAEKLLLYLKLPSSTSSPFDPLRQPLNPLGNRQEIQQTIVWIKTHLEEDSEISIPKQDVYDQYLKYCENVSMKPLSTADFGKVMKQVYPGVRPRRLGTRGNSRYCYSGMRNTCKLPVPILPQSNAEDKVSNGGADDGSSLPVENNKIKKLDRTKKKLKLTTRRSDKCTSLNQNNSVLEKDSSLNVKVLKRAKLEGKELEANGFNKGGNPLDSVEGIKEEVNLSGLKCEENSNNSFNTFEIECGLDSDFGIYLGSAENVTGDSPTRSSFVCESPAGMETEEKQNELQKILFSRNDSLQIATLKESNKSFSKGNLFSIVSNKSTEKSNINVFVKGKVVNAYEPKLSLLEQRKTIKGRARRSAFFTKPIKNQRKCYVPIQPKPVDIDKFNVRFENPVNINQFASEHNREPEGPSLCEESDSQEPEEEIIRYFKHLDGKDLNLNNVVDQTVNNVESAIVQNSHLPQTISKNSAYYRKVDDLLNNVSENISRSQSCLEVQRQLFNLNENVDSVLGPRSQSSVELPASLEQNPQEVSDSDYNGKNKKISHLRILLEKSISKGNKVTYSGVRENGLPNCQPVISNAQIATSVSQLPTNGSHSLLSPAKLMEREFLKYNGFKIVSTGSSFVPQSPSYRTKYFSFTPISPGPLSPLKTPSTPSASPFVSPRNTPVPRSRQNSTNEFFLLPSERKSTPLRSDCVKNEFISEINFNISKTGNCRVDKNKQSTYLQGGRPRSFSSTNFCRTKARRNSSKLVSFDENLASANNRSVTTAQKDLFLNSQLSIHKNFVSSECLSNEVHNVLEKNSVITEDRSATIRSQSVPLSRMISESTWMPNQAASVYSSYFNSGSTNPTLTPISGKFPEWNSNSETNSPKDITTNVSPFFTNGEMTRVEPGPLNSEVFTEDPTMVQLDQYFAEDFRSNNEHHFSRNDPFNEESAFSNKLDLHSSGTFDSPFTNESDPSINDNIKSYLPDFEGLENKNSDNGESVGNERKLLKTSLYERNNDNLKDPVITSFKPVITNEVSSSSGSPVLNFFGNKINEDNQQLIEFFDFED